MSAKFNNFCELEIVGTVTKDPEGKMTPEGKLFVNVSLVYNDFVGKSDTNTKGTVAMWVHLTAWEKTAEIVNQYLHKGDVLHAKCRIRFDAQTGNPRIFTRNDGSAGSSFEATIKECTIISKGNGNGNGNVANGGNDADAFAPADFDAYQGQPESAPQQFVPQTPAPQQFVPQQTPQYQQPAPQQQFAPQQPRPQQFVPQPQAQPQYQPQAAPQQPQAPQQYQQPQQQQGGFTVPQQPGNNGKRSW